MEAKICYGVNTENILLEASKFLLSIYGLINNLQESSHTAILELSQAMVSPENQEKSVAAAAWKVDMMRRKLIKIDKKLEDSYDILLGYNNLLEKIREEKEKKEGVENEQKHEER
jgi:hypothetical protein